MIKSIIQIFLLISVSLFSSVLAAEKNKEINIMSFCPAENEIDNWQPDGEPEIVIGDELYLMINGGAEIYYEYGFKQAVFVSYINLTGSRINLEIFEMQDAPAAYGMYTFKTGIKGKSINVGQQGWLESYFLNFWKGKYLVTIIGLDPEADLIEDIINIARNIDSKINFSTGIPEIVNYLPEENRQANGITYLKGNLALFNQHQFDSKDIFGIAEGVVGRYSDYTVFIFQYLDKAETKKWFNFSKSFLQESERCLNFKQDNVHFEFRDVKNNTIRIKHFRRWILIIMGNSHLNVSQIFSSIEKRIKL